MWPILRLQTVTTALRRFLCFCIACLLSIVFTLAISLDGHAQDQPIEKKADLVQDESGVTDEKAPKAIDTSEPPEVQKSTIVGIENEVLKPVIKIEEQPFYAELQRLALFWDDSPIGHVEDRAPKETLLNF